MEQFEKRIINWLIIIFWVIIDFLLIPIGFIYLWPEQMKMILAQFGDMDFLAFLGAIIGGGLTLFGVKRTLDVQKTEKFIESFPKKIKKFDEILDNIDGFYPHINFNNAPLMAYSYNYFDRFLEPAAEINGGVYTILRQINKYFSDEVLFVMSIFYEKNQSDEYYVKGDEVELKRLENKLLEQLSRDILLLHNHRAAMFQRYVDYAAMKPFNIEKF